MTVASQLLGRVRDEIGRLDLLINNVGITNTQPFERRAMESIRHEVNVNLMVPLALTHALLPQLRRAPDGRVISIVSLGGVFPMPETTVFRNPNSNGVQAMSQDKGVLFPTP
jgi:hypothetical protein